MALLVHIYALAGTEIQFSSQQEQQLQEAIADAILEDIAKCKKDTINSKKYQQILCTFGTYKGNVIIIILSYLINLLYTKI